MGAVRVHQMLVQVLQNQKVQVLREEEQEHQKD